MFKAVLIALSNSSLDKATIANAQQLNLEPGTKVILVHVLPYAQDQSEQDVSRPLSVDVELPNHQLEEYLRALGKEFSHAKVVFEVVQGEAEVEIIRLAHIYNVDLIILGTRGLTGVDRILARSISSEVVEQAPCTVMVVKSDE
jgi:nucleotide-binding universal stress UspA family protein